jgi:Flp pilus assembly protein TadG
MSATGPGRERGEDGQVMLLMVFFAVIIAGLITVVVDVSTVFLAQRQMQSTADGAALAAAQQVDLPAIYAGDLGPELPLSRATAVGVIDAYATTRARIPGACSASTYQVIGGRDGSGNGPSGIQPDGQTVRVELTCKVAVPFLGLVTDPFTGGVTIHETAHAQAAVTPPGP